MKNEEMQNLIKIIGLKAKEEYTSLKDLRYGSVMIMADQVIFLCYNIIIIFYFLYIFFNFSYNI